MAEARLFFVKDAGHSRTRRSSPPLATGRGIVAAGHSVRRLIRPPLDPHHRQNDHVGRLGIGVDVTAAAQRTLPLRKLHYDSHAPSPPTADGCSATATVRR